MPKEDVVSSVSPVLSYHCLSSSVGPPYLKDHHSHGGGGCAQVGDLLQ